MDDRITVGHVLKPQGIRGEIKIKPAIFTCGDIGVETEANDVRFNIPELFIDDDSTGNTVEDWMT